MRNKLKILFDFDGTLCKVETIPFVASSLHIDNCVDIKNLTEESCKSAYSYEDNLRTRISMMNEVTISEFVNCISEDLLRSALVYFIKENVDVCGIASCNLDCWCVPITSFLGVACRFSEAMVNDGRVTGIKEVLNKSAVVEEYQRNGYYVVFVGDSANDIDAMTKADKAILLCNENFRTRELDQKIVLVDSEENLLNILDSLIKSLSL